MSLFAQHGYGKSDKINRGLDAGVLDGVIMSPRDELPKNLRAYLSALHKKYKKVPVLFDPQFYVTTITPVKDGNLPSYPYYHSGLTRRNFTSPESIEGYVRETLDYQAKLPISQMISPTVYFDNFNDPWSQISLSMAEGSINYHSKALKKPPLLVSLVFSENALSSSESLSEFLDIISGFKVAGFYIIVKRSSSQYMTQMEPVVLENLLYLVYVLSELNRYEVVVGYADIIGILLHAVGAKVTACGWFNSLRQFSLARFQPSTGGRAPRPRYTSIPLLNSILVLPELDLIYRAGLINDVLSGTSCDKILRPNPANAAWTPDISCLHHWEAVHSTIKTLSHASINQRLAIMMGMIAKAQAIYARLDNRHVIFDTYSGRGHLDQWNRAIQGFKTAANIK